MSNNELCFHTGSDLLDEVVGGGIWEGYPGGKIINIVSDKSGGKTSLALEAVAAAHHRLGKKLKKRYDNAESGLTHDVKEIYHFEFDDIEGIKSRTVEEFYCNYRLFLESIKKDEFGIYVLDSLDGLSSDEIEERGKARVSAFKKGKDFNKGSYQMGTPKFLSQEFFRGLAGMTDEKNCLLIIISQTRDAINSMFAEQKRSGGKALDFYAFCCLWLANVHKIKKQGRVIGVIIKASAKKSKTPRPYRECVFPLYFTYGIDNIGANIDFLYDLRGKDFDLLSTAKAIEWNKQEGTNKIELKNITELLEKSNVFDTYQEWAEGKELKTKKDKLNSMLEYIQDQKDGSEIKQEFKKQYGQTFTRDELIRHIEQNNLQAELTRRVKNKWEAIEQEIKVDRPGKYS
jgi:RecA/RadA recombinase